MCKGGDGNGQVQERDRSCVVVGGGIAVDDAGMGEVRGKADSGCNGANRVRIADCSDADRNRDAITDDLYPGGNGTGTVGVDGNGKLCDGGGFGGNAGII